MLTPRTFEGPQIVSRLLWFNARQIHLRRAHWALWSRANRRVFTGVFRKRHLRLPCLQAGVPETLSHRRLTEIAVGDAPQYALFPCGTGPLGLNVHRYWRMRYCSAECITAYQRRLDEETAGKIRCLEARTGDACILATLQGGAKEAA